MNDRIKELAEQARLLTGWPVGEIEYQKFAELIVRECCDVLFDNELGGYQVNHVLKQHFGIE